MIAEKSLILLMLFTIYMDQLLNRLEESSLGFGAYLFVFCDLNAYFQL